MTEDGDDSFRDCGKELVKVTRFGVAVRVFALRRKNVTSYLLAYYLHGKRVRETFKGSLDEAKTHAAEIAKKVSEQTAGNGLLPLADVQVYQHAVERLKTVGVPLAVAIAEYIDAKQKIGGRPLSEAVGSFLKHEALDLPQKTLAEVAQEMLDAKKMDGIGILYRKQLRCLLEPACNTLTKPISEITTAEVDDYLRGLNRSTRSRYNARAALVSAFEFAKSREYLPRDRTTAAALAASIRVKSGEVEIFTPAEMTALLEAAESDAEALPLIAFGGFAGLRTAEIGRLQWEDIDLVQGHITVSAAKAKTASRRIIPIQENLSRWLQPWANASGLVFKPKDATKVEKRVSKAAGVAWKHNALRHSFGSYRLAAIKNAPEVALEMGNSPQMIFKHYRELVTPRDAAAWWAIVPKRAGNVIPMQATAAEG